MDFWIRCIPRKIEEKVVYQEIIDSFLIELGGFFFLFGYHSNDKSFLWKNLYAGLRSNELTDTNDE